jgi:hypothetical protein
MVERVGRTRLLILLAVSLAIAALIALPELLASEQVGDVPPIELEDGRSKPDRGDKRPEPRGGGKDRRPTGSTSTGVEGTPAPTPSPPPSPTPGPGGPSPSPSPSPTPPPPPPPPIDDDDDDDADEGDFDDDGGDD